MAEKDSYTDFLKKDFQQLFESMELQPRQEHFMRSRWLDQVLWMEKKAGTCRKRHQFLRLTTIILGVIVPIIIGFNFADNTLNKRLRAITAILSGVVAVSAAVEEFFHYGERWYHYRRTAESLKQHGWQLSQLTGPYKKYIACDTAFPTFAENVEEILQKDVEGYVTQGKQALSEEENSNPKSETT
ncbi:MAG: DUF4231 domain-containing protein [Cyanobacteria bacterium P01_F01_bin.150]